MPPSTDAVEGGRKDEGIRQEPPVGRGPPVRGWDAHRYCHARIREKARAETEALQAAVQEIGAAAFQTHDPERAWRGSAAINYTIPGADICTVYARN